MHRPGHDDGSSILSCLIDEVLGDEQEVDDVRCANLLEFARESVLLHVSILPAQAKVETLVLGSAEHRTRVTRHEL